MRLTRHTEAETFNRKEMVKALGEYLGVRPHYEGMPSRAYTVGAFAVDFEGAIIGDDFTPIREFLISEGYAQPDDFEAPAEAQTEDEQAADEEPETGTVVDAPLVSITFPVPDMTVTGLKNLVFMLYTKQVLLNHALGLDVLTIDKNLISRLQEYTPASMEEFSVILKDAHGLDMLEGFMYEDGKVTMTFPQRQGSYRPRRYRIQGLGKQGVYHRRQYVWRFVSCDERWWSEEEVLLYVLHLYRRLRLG